ncbi:hypothetical protein GGS21DRAFT_331230 [Xylaria nigripes]|nr:hypothetical protein GGS21DRAFT_331230 [Xylaria nigripes]
MAFTQTSYLNPSCYLLYTEPELSMDPEDKHSASPTSTIGSWPVGRYLMDSKMPFPVYPVIDTVTPGVVAPFPSPHFQRAESPSYTNISSTCSSGLSPPAETDYCHAYSPPTPSDPPLLSQYESYPQVYEFTGLADGCVNLGDVNPIQDFPCSYFDSNVLNLSPHQRTCSMSSDESNISTKGWNDEVFQQPRCLSPVTTEIKEEIRLADSLESRYMSEDDQIESVTDVESPCLTSLPKENEGEVEVDIKSCRQSENKLPKSNRNGKRRSTSQSFAIAKRPKTSMVKSLAVSANNKPILQGAKGQYECQDCPKSFKDQAGLNSHIKKQHTRPFTCIFEFAGCRSTFPSKNEWKRHCSSQHIVLQYWVCQQDACAQVSNKLNTPKKFSGAARKRIHCPEYNVDCPSTLPNGTIFNRKDLYTQHLRRMHVPTHLKSKVKLKTPVPEWEEQQRVHQDRAIRIRCHLPEHMSCPAPNCSAQFEGSNAWDDRMEHVAKHLEKAAAGLEPPVPFGSETDDSLIDWATSPAIGILRKGDKGKWTLQNPLKAYTHTTLSANEGCEDADAEGEEIEE